MYWEDRHTVRLTVRAVVATVRSNFFSLSFTQPYCAISRAASQGSTFSLVGKTVPWPLICESDSECDEDGSQEGPGAVAITKTPP